MSKVSMSIEFDRPDRTYAPGEDVRGMVDIQTDQECTCSGLTVRARWRTHGRGNQDTGALATTRVTSAKALKPGIVYRHHFRFEAPREPTTYHGHYINIDWYVEAKAVIRVTPKALFSRSTKQEAEFLLHCPDTPIQVRPWSSARSALGVYFLFAVVGFILGMAWLTAVLTLPAGGAWGFVLPALAITLGGFLGAFYWPDLKLGAVHVELASRGQDIWCRVRFAPRLAIGSCRVMATLEVEEHCVSGSGSTAEHHRHCLFEAHSAKDNAQRMRAGQDTAVELVLTPAQGLPASFKAGANQINWSITVTVIFRRWLNWAWGIPIVVSR